MKIIEHSEIYSLKYITFQECSKIDFNPIPLDKAQIAILASMNRQIIQLCRSLPLSLQSNAVIAIQEYYTGFEITNLLNFFNKLYPPSWSLIHWMQEANPVLRPSEMENAFSCQALAHFLCMLDNHLSSGKIPINHLLLQLRTQAWVQYNNNIMKLTQNIAGGEGFVQELINTYFSSVHESDNVEGIDAYCNLFRKQLCTKLAAPMLVAKHTDFDTNLIRQSYESFCIAWRLLDDLRDCYDDAMKGKMTAVYQLLSSESRQLWLSCQGKNEESYRWKTLKHSIEQQRVLSELVLLICDYLEQAQTKADLAQLNGYATQIKYLKENFCLG